MKIYGFKTSRHRKNLETFLSKIEINGIILDIGGAQKPIIGRISAKSKILRSYILDLPNPHTGSKNQIDFPTDIQEVNFEFLKYQNQYDAIFCLEVSLYWKDTKQAIANISKLMNDKTSLYVSFHQIYSPQKPNGKDFLRYSNDWIQEIFNDYDLEIVEDFSTKLHPVSKICLKILHKVERMRINPNYTHKYVSTLSYIVRLKR